MYLCIYIFLWTHFKLNYKQNGVFRMKDTGKTIEEYERENDPMSIEN